MLSTYGLNLMAGLMTGQGTLPTYWYIALLTAYPAATDTGSTIVEPTTGSYAREQIGVGTTNWTPPSSDGLMTYKNLVEWPTPTAAWGRIVAWAACTAASGGQVIAYDSVASPIEVTTGRVVNMPPYSLGISLRSVS